MVTGPHISPSFCRVKFLIRQRIRVLFPTLGGPTTTTTTGGGSRGVRSTTGMWCFLVFISWALQKFIKQWAVSPHLHQCSDFHWFLTEFTIRNWHIHRLFIIYTNKVHSSCLSDSDQDWPVEGLGHAHSRLNCKSFGITFPLILFCGGSLLLEFLPLCLRSAMLLLMLLLFLNFPIHSVD